MAAGTAEVAFAVETAYKDPGDVPTWIQPFTDIEVDGPTLDNQLVRQRQPDSPKSARSREGNLQGEFTVTGTLTDDNWHALVFPENSNTALPDSGDSEWPSSTWYFSADVPGVNQERFCAGAFPTQASIEYQQGEDIRVSLTMQYATELDDVDSPGTIDQPDEADGFMWHGMDVDRASTEVAASELSSLTITLGNLARGRRGQSREFTRAVTDAFELEFSMNAPFVESDQLELAFGSAAETTPQDTIDQTDFSVDVTNAGGTTHTYGLDGAQPTSHSWSQLVGAEDITEDVTFHVADIGVTVA